MSQTLQTFRGRRQVLIGLAAMLGAPPLRALAKAPPPASGTALNATDLGLLPDSDADQSAALQRAVDTASERLLPLFLPGGSYRAGNIKLRGPLSITGVDGATRLIATRDAPILLSQGQADITLRSLAFDGSGGGPTADRMGLLSFVGCANLRLDGVVARQGSGNGLYLDDCSGWITASSFSGHAAAAIFAINSHALTLSQNRVLNCGNGGILVWRDAAGADGTIVSGNHVSGILAKAGGSGQNGNGINIFRADDVVVTDNLISDCDFSAVRANSTRNAAIRGNTCTNCREVAIYSEFAFSGSVIVGNVIDGAAAGISITNFDQGGKLAVCADNIVRNIMASSPTNPDVTPYGIYAEAATAINGNTVSSVPGVGIGAGTGKFLKDVLISNNVIEDVNTGIAVSVVDGAGAVRIAGNMISGVKLQAIAGMHWDQVVSPDLVADAAKFRNVSIDGNLVSP